MDDERLKQGGNRYFEELAVGTGTYSHLADINQVKADVLPFIRNPKEMGIWSNDYFLQLAQMIRFE